jgi:hypothetical protein
MRLPLSSDIQRVAWAICAAMVTLITWWRLRREEDIDVQWALVLSVMLVVSPLGWIYYWLVPALPIAKVIPLRAQWVGRVSTAGILLPPLVVVLPALFTSNAWLIAAAYSAYGIVALIVWFGLVEKVAVAAPVTV